MPLTNSRQTAALRQRLAGVRAGNMSVDASNAQRASVGGWEQGSKGLLHGGVPWARLGGGQQEGGGAGEDPYGELARMAAGVAGGGGPMMGGGTGQSYADFMSGAGGPKALRFAPEVNPLGSPMRAGELALRNMNFGQLAQQRLSPVANKQAIPGLGQQPSMFSNPFQRRQMV